MTFYYYEGRNFAAAYRKCPHCGADMEEENIVLGVQILRCPFCGEWKEE